MYQNTWYILSTQQMMVIIVDIINILKPNMTKYQSLIYIDNHQHLMRSFIKFGLSVFGSKVIIIKLIKHILLFFLWILNVCTLIFFSTESYWIIYYLLCRKQWIKNATQHMLENHYLHTLQFISNTICLILFSSFLAFRKGLKTL